MRRLERYAATRATGLYETVIYRTFCLQVILDPKTSRKIFELARDQQEELEEDEEDEDEEEQSKPSFTTARTQEGDEVEEDDLGEEEEYEEEEVEEIVRPELIPHFTLLIDRRKWTRGICVH